MIITLGTSNRTPGEFFRELERRDVRFLLDVRSRPASRLPWASGASLAIASATKGIEYAWGGAALGGLTSLRTDSRDFRIAADAIVDQAEIAPVALVCAEGDPALCHRSWKVGAYLFLELGAPVSNVLRNGKEEPIAGTLARTASNDIPPCLRDRLTSAIGQADLLSLIKLGF